MIGLILGIGIGLLVSSSVNIISHRNEKNIVDEKFIRGEARKLGMVDPVKYFNKAETNKDGDEQNNDSKNKNEEKVPIIEVEIVKGYGSEEIARLLKENGLIKSEEAFLEKIHKRGLANKLRKGTYEFSSKDSEDLIIDKIINGGYIKE